MSFKGHTVVVTGAGGGLGKTYSLLFASRGANVKVVDEMFKVTGGKAVVNTSSVSDGAAVIKSAVDAFGTVTILINNAGILRDKGFKNLTDKEWDQITEVHLKGAFSCTKAAWPLFRKQKFGRVINTASAAGLYGNFGQANYSAAKMGLIGFTKTLAREGAKYGIKSSAIAPMAASAMTETVMPPEMLANLSPEYVAPFVAAFATPTVFEVGAGFVAELRWERSNGTIFKTDESFTPSAGKLETAKKLPPNVQASPAVRFDGQTVIITGAGAGLGRAYALMYAKLGANVVVNDVSEKGANAVVDEITRAGGKAAAAVFSVEEGQKIVQVALEKFGGVHILIANAGILRDKSFQAMTEQEWDAVLAVHLRGTYKVANAVWPLFQKQKYGRIVTTASQYSTAKAGIIGLTRTLAIEGKKYNILANVIAPSAGTAMTSTIWPQEMVDAFKPDFIAPVVGYLTSKDNTETSGSLFEVSGGWAAQTRWQRSGGHGFPVDKPYTVEDVFSQWTKITNFANINAKDTGSFMESHTTLTDLSSNPTSTMPFNDPNAFTDPEDSQLVKDAKKDTFDPVPYSYTERDVILYNLGIGATEKELKWVFEGDDEFSALPTFGVIPQFACSSAIPLDWLPNFNPAKLLHGEQYLNIKGPIPTSGELVSEARLLEVLDKGKAAAVTTIIETRDKSTGKLIFENQSTVFIRGSGGFGGKRTGNDRGAASAVNEPPKCKPDAVLEEKTSTNQAALYRLSGDYNPLHILPEFAAIGGFDQPILHGLCSMGIAGKHVLKAYGPYKDIKVRFAGVVYPGETIVTEMWKEGQKVIFTAKVKERNTIALAAAAVTLVDSSTKSKL
ncbi:multifunctional beta-oxidation protein [Pholiota molesta]|nr:multifunctional beta-oxidation protein [Pholiota molesta]